MPLSSDASWIQIISAHRYADGPEFQGSALDIAELMIDLSEPANTIAFMRQSVRLPLRQTLADLPLQMVRRVHGLFFRNDVRELQFPAHGPQRFTPELMYQLYFRRKKVQLSRFDAPILTSLARGNYAVYQLRNELEKWLSHAEIGPLIREHRSMQTPRSPEVG